MRDSVQQTITAKSGSKNVARSTRQECFVVGVGASAGGLEAYKQLLSSISDDSGMAFVFVQHLDPTHESLMTELLSKHTTMPVSQIENAMSIRPNHVYMIPPNSFVTLRDERLFLEAPPGERGVRLPIDHFFRSLAKAREERAIGVVLSGTGSDGADGVREIKAYGGMTIAQQPDTAEHDGMPRAAVGTGAVDFVLPIAEIADLISPFVQNPYIQSGSRTHIAESDPDHFRAILQLLRAATDQDFSRYKTGTLTRRIERRMSMHHISRPAEYLQLLHKDQKELRALFKDLLIGVTQFFRDSDSWGVLSNALSAVFSDKKENEPFRVWVPGCSTGEEAYSIAIMLFELQRQHKRIVDIQVFATDIDADAIDVARQGLYPNGITKNIPDEYLAMYFEGEGEKLRVKKTLRESCIFATQNLLSDPPFSNLDLVSCRNLLIYLESDMQERVFEMMHFALSSTGFLFLGSSESPAQHKQLFDVISGPARIYRKLGDSKPGSRGYPVEPSAARHHRATTEDEDAKISKNTTIVELSTRALLNTFAPASVVVNSSGTIAFIHGSVRNYLDFPAGEPELNLGAMALDGLKAEIRAGLQQSKINNKAYTAVTRQISHGDGFRSIRVHVTPLPAASGREPLYLVSFMDENAAQDKLTQDDSPMVPMDARGSSDANNAGATHGQISQELQALREDLQSTIEELESANEELTASNDEVMSMIEELQSSNEELETSREELQSLNKKLSAVNNQLHDKVEELEATTNDLTNLLSSTELPTIFLDSKLRIRRFTPAISQLMHIVETDIGRPVSDLMPRAQDPELVEDARIVLNSRTPVEREVQDSDGRWFMRRITPYRTAEFKIEGVVAFYTDITQIKRATEQLSARERQQAVIAQLGRRALVGDTLQSLFEQATELVAEALDIKLVKVLRVSADQEQLELVAGVGWHEGLVGVASVGTGIESQGGYTLHSAAPVIVFDLDKEERFSGPVLLEDHAVVSGMSVIIGPETSPWGVFGAHSTEHVEFTVDDTNFIVAVANVLWEAIERHRNETQMKQRLAEINSIYQSSPVGLCCVDADLRFTRVNSSLAETHGLPEEDHIGRTLRQVLPALADKLEPIYQQVFTTGEPLLDIEIQGTTSADPDNLKSWLVNYSPFSTDEGVIRVNTSVMDITDRIQSEKASIDNARRLQRLVDSAAVGIAFAAANGELVQANGALLTMFKLSRQEFQQHGWTWTDKFLPRGELFMQVLQRLAKTNTTESMEIRWRHDDSSSLWVLLSVNELDSSGAEFVVCMSDITAQKHAELALAESEERLRLAARLAEFGTYFKDIATGEVHWSPELREMLGLDAEAPSPADFTTVPHFMDEADRTRIAHAMDSSLDPTGDGEFSEELHIARAEGGERWLLMQGRTIFRGKDERRRASRIAGIVIDITERHHFEAQLEEARREAVSASAAKTTFLANMSHEIRTPMTAILGYAEVLDVRIKDPDVKACVKTIKENGAYLCDILDDILDLSRVESGKVKVHFESLSLLGLLAEIRSLMTVRATQSSLSLALDFDGQIPTEITTDPKLVRQILVNLVGNAIKFTDHGGVRVVSRCIREREVMEISVIDTGIGIHQKDQDRLFLPFEQLDDSMTRSVGGTGLGLAISKHLVGLLGGDLQLQSEVGKGTTFTVTLPCGNLAGAEWISPDPKALRAKFIDTKTDQLPRINGRVLGADDRPEIRVLIREFLEAAGAEVELASDGQRVLDSYQDHYSRDVPIDAILMDLQMPVMDGLQAAAELRAAGYKGPIVALTANVMQSDRERALQAGFDDFITKPIDRPILITSMAKWVECGTTRGSQEQIAVLCVEDNVAACNAQKLLLESRGFKVKTAHSAEDALRTVENFTPDVALLDLGLPDTSGEELLAQLKTKPTLVNTVFICVTGRSSQEIDWEGIGFDTFLRKPIDINLLEKTILRSQNDN